MLVGVPPYFSNNREQLFSNIEKGELKIPKSLSNESKDLLKKLLERDQNLRLGSGPRDANSIKEH